MFLADANVLLYAKFTSFEEHDRARRWLDGVLNFGPRCGLPWETITAFVRIATSARVFEHPLRTSAAWEQIKAWLSCEYAWIPTPSERHLQTLDSLMPFAAGAPGLVDDAHLAALARDHGLTVVSADGDFARFPGVTWENPLLAE